MPTNIFFQFINMETFAVRMKKPNSCYPGDAKRLAIGQVQERTGCILKENNGICTVEYPHKLTADARLAIERAMEETGCFDLGSREEAGV